MMKRCVLAVTIAALVLGSAAAAHAQAMPAASRPGLIEGGIAISSGQTDEVIKRVTGATAWGIFDFTEHLGVEFTVHIMSLNTPQDYSQHMYLIGPRYKVTYKDRYEPYVRAQIGIGSGISLEPYTATVATAGQSYAAYAFAGGLDIRVPKNFTVRAIDYEYELWPGVKPHGLSPNMVSIGFAYRFF